MSSSLFNLLAALSGLIMVLLIKGASIMGIGSAGIVQKLLRMAGFQRSSEPIGTRQLFEKQFSQITRLFGKRRLVLFIDDLDRCEKDYTMKVLETSNFLASSGELFIVLGMAPRYVVANVNLHFASLAEAVHEVEQDSNHGSGEAETKPQSSISFARRYLQKLVNIEVPVPKASGIQTKEMLLGSGGEVDPEGDAMEKLDRVITHGKQLVWSGLLLLALLAYPVYHFASHNPQEIAKQQSDRQAATETNPAPTAIKKTDITEPPKRDRTSEEGRFIPGDTATRPWWVISASPALFSLTLLILLLAYRFRNDMERFRPLLKRLGIALSGPVQTEDSEDFSKALNIWSPVLFSADPNPRKLKTFLNHLRYMSSRMVEENTTAKKNTAKEANLVAISALHYALGRDAKNLDGTFKPSGDNPLGKSITKAWQEHKQTFPSLPKEDEWKRYMHFNEDVVIQSTESP